MLGNITLAQRGVQEGTDLFERLLDAEKATLRAKGLAQLLLTFSKGGNPVRQPAFIGELLRDSAGFALHGSNVTCSFMIADDLMPAQVDIVQIGQVISNLVINAVQAMQDGGEISIVAKNLAPGEFPNGSREADGFICFTVQDSGPGIPEAQLERIFDRFYRGDESRSSPGFGLGLAIAQTLITAQRGHLEVLSEVDKGSAFIITLPKAP